MLNNAIAQAGPWKAQNLNITANWFLHELETKIIHIDWQTAIQDVARFLKPGELETLELCSKDFFLSCLEKLSG